MKTKLLTIISALMCFSVAYAQNPNAPEIIFEQESIDYGTIDYASDGTREFKFINTGNQPLIIYSATGSCGCLVPDPTSYKDPIQPGQTGHIKVHYDTKRVGSFEKTVTVSSNAKTPSKVLKIHGQVNSAPTVAPAPVVADNPTSQDNIIMLNDNVVKAKVEKVGVDIIQYHTTDNLDGPLYEVRTADVYMIVYKNGTRRVINPR